MEKRKLSAEEETISMEIEDLKKLLERVQSSLVQAKAVFTTTPWDTELYGEIVQKERDIETIKLKISTLEAELSGKKREYFK